MNLLVTGGTGHLGRDVVRAATAAGQAVRIASRKARPAGGAVAAGATDAAAATEWATLDFATGAGLREALAGIDAVVHAASDHRNSAVADVEGTRLLVAAAREARVAHLIFVSIVGIDRIPLPYYQHKLAIERLLAESGLPYSILRATQFHWFVDYLIGQAARVPFVLPLAAGFHMQSVATEDVAARLLAALADGPRGMLRNFVGPEAMTLAAAAETWKSVRRVKKPTLPIWLPGSVAAAFRAGHNTAPEGERGVIRWKEWLRGNAQSREWS